jgi:hypothetical protein
VDGVAAKELLAGIEARDFERIERCFASEARLRALTPHQLRELDGPGAIAGQYRRWLEALEGYRLLDGGTETIADRIRVRYHFRGRDPAKGWQENEHTAYAELDDAGSIVALNLSCAGFRPAEPPA